MMYIPTGNTRTMGRAGDVQTKPMVEKQILRVEGTARGLLDCLRKDYVGIRSGAAMLRLAHVEAAPLKAPGGPHKAYRDHSTTWRVVHCKRARQGILRIVRKRKLGEKTD